MNRANASRSKLLTQDCAYSAPTSACPKYSPLCIYPLPSSYEILYPLCTSISSRMHRFEKHLVRIYGPTYRALQRMPEMWMDGTQARLAGQIYERALSGDGLVLGQRLLESSWTMLKKWKESLGSGGGTEGNEGGGVGGTHPSAGQHKGGNGVDSQNGVPGRGPPPGFGPPPVEPPPPAA